MAYSKLDSGIIHSTMWSEPHDVRVTWITLLAVTDADGMVRMAIPALAKLVDVSVDRIKEILAHLESPDEYSRTKEHDGRRIAAVDGGWKLLNYQRYRQGSSSTDATNAERQRRFRERSRTQPKPLHSVTVTGRNGQAEAEAEAEAEADLEDTCSAASPEATELVPGSGDENLTPDLLGEPKGLFRPSAKKLYLSHPGPYIVNEDDVTMWFPAVRCLDDRGWPLFKEHARQLHASFSTRFTAQQCRDELLKAKSWLINNPKLQKTAGGLPRFLNNWLERACR